MEQTLYKICHNCSDTIVEGCDSMTLEQAELWLSENNQVLETPGECGDTVKYIIIPVSEA
jgi:hypothetical protein